VSELLQELNGRPYGESVNNLKTFYDQAAQAFPDTYKKLFLHAVHGFLAAAETAHDNHGPRYADSGG
jgi:hypothetical protein